MQTLSTNCPSCRNVVSVPAAGDYACPHCNGLIRVLQAIPANAGVRPPPLPVQNSEPIEEDLLAIFSNAPPAGRNGATKFCHHCGSTITAFAEICPKCGVR